MVELANIFEIQKMSTEDGPGIRTTVFFKHCPLKCAWCHNPESISHKPQLEWLKHKCIGCKICVEMCEQNALFFDEEGLHINRDFCIGCGSCVKECPSTALHMFGQKWDVEELYNEIAKDKIYYEKSNGGVTISGGEPTLQPAVVERFLKKCKENGISTALDTCGYASQEIYKKLLPHVDLVLLDIKEIDSEKHKQFTGVPNDKILENAQWLAQYLKESNKKLWIRTPLIPKYTATEDNIRSIGRFIVNELQNFPERWDLLSFNNLCQDKYSRLDMEWILKDVPLMKAKEIENLYDIAEATGVKNVQWSGLTKREKREETKANKDDKIKLSSCGN
ncbi:MAG: glycyl-radical enzyme activating protein [Candidatus Lokiarchaeota archaeon]|nr:glycyl-radical enzyme activating protein [Candidatus Lokiarchaeota archaeon]MBD3341143.1 glycyl-radical enzyme activating protein [Candidatus Lokiarchaeota archaeon]